MKKRIVCFGDSNTWGFNPKSGGRFPEGIRWTSIMGSRLGDEYVVIEEGLCGRTTVWDDKIENVASGKSYIATSINTHYPFDLIIIMLGTNDLKSRFSVCSEDIAKSAASLAKCVLLHDYKFIENSKIPKVLLVSPIHVGDCIFDTESGYMMCSDAYEKSKGFAGHYKKYADILGIDFLDAALYANPSSSDYLHIDKDGQQNLAIAMTKKVKEIIG